MSSATLEVKTVSVKQPRTIQWPEECWIAQGRLCEKPRASPNFEQSGLDLNCDTKDSGEHFRSVRPQNCKRYKEYLVFRYVMCQKLKLLLIVQPHTFPKLFPPLIMY